MPLREPAITRHVPAENPATGLRWRYIEILGNHALVAVDVPQAVHDRIAVDTDFHPIPTGAKTITDLTIQQRVLNKLQALGYTKAEILAANWDVRALLKLVGAKLTTRDVAPIREYFLREVSSDGLP